MLIFAFLLIAFAFANNNAGGLDAPQLKVCNSSTLFNIYFFQHLIEILSLY